MHKCFAMVALSRLMGYEFLISTDDDVLVPPSAWRALLAAPPRFGTCGVAIPLIHNAVPTGRAFAARALGPAAVARLDACFAGTELGWKGRIPMGLIPQPIAP